MSKREKVGQGSGARYVRRDEKGQFTSDHGWSFPADAKRLQPLVAEARSLGVRVSLFMDPVPEAMAAVKAVGADRVELYTESYASAWGTERQPDVVRAFADTARAAHAVPFGRAILQVAIADISMSVDNALAVAGAANQNVPVLITGLVLSVAIMGIAAGYVAKLLQRYPSLSWLGVLLVLYIALEMIWRGTGDIPELLRRLTLS